MAEKILIVDDDPGMQIALNEFLKKRGYETDSAVSAEEALDRVKHTSYDLIFLDVRLPGMTGIDAICRIRNSDEQGEIIVITAHGTRDVALEAVRNGAYDYFTKPFSLQEMDVVIRRALEKRKLQKELNELRKRTGTTEPIDRIIGQSEGMKRVKAMVARIAPLETTVLVTGESGTGKELVADLLHMLSARASGPCIKINCASIPETLLESELFGYERGAFTGAVSSRQGKFEQAHTGTIFLDEIGDMPSSLQAKLLRVVEQKQVDRLGGKKPVKVDVRVVAATNRDLLELVTRKEFRADLYYRLNVAAIHVPPLRDRKEDLPLLVGHFLREINVKLGTDLSGISREAMELLFGHDWPGNVRELANLLERVAIVNRGTTVSPEAVRIALQKHSNTLAEEEGQAMTLGDTLDELERNLILDALRKCGGVQTRAAEMLGLSAKNFWKKMKKHGIRYDGERHTEEFSQ
ncbi:MAG TPA: sigma-54 dependent transcriptional regulator [Syntrophobacter fumaroxidans]|nr:sigma-54 dependent transcriptional regulator [Syntrophobacter fumaroxidans]